MVQLQLPFKKKMMTQAEIVWDILLRGKAISQSDAFDMGIKHLAAVIHTIRKQYGTRMIVFEREFDCYCLLTIARRLKK